jgi:hypothetical protein
MEQQQQQQQTLQFQGGRLGNRFFGNLALHFLAMKHNIPINYTRESEFQQLGLTFFKANARPLHHPTSLEITFMATILKVPPMPPTRVTLASCDRPISLSLCLEKPSENKHSELQWLDLALG